MERTKRSAKNEHLFELEQMLLEVKMRLSLTGFLASFSTACFFVDKNIGYFELERGFCFNFIFSEDTFYNQSIISSDIFVITFDFWWNFEFLLYYWLWGEFSIGPFQGNSSTSSKETAKSRQVWKKLSEVNGFVFVLFWNS